MNTKQTLQLLLFFVGTTIASAQQLYLEAGKTSSSFDYKNSQGERLDNLQASNHTFMSLGYRDNLASSEKLNGSLGIGYAGYGAIGSDNTLEGILEWNVNYLELNAGLDFNLFAIHDSAFYLKGLFSTGVLLQGTQSFNNEVINLKNADDFDKTMFSFKAGAGFLHPVSDELSFYVQYLFGKSLNQSGNDDYESLRIESHNISLGALIEL
ncbi:outer membrane beta-barrel protein [Confluentibacter flavum]|uniref:Uncharacterized protein n=1 Tax=Confluentibacter flavum TaxID=1909700 RepID=A0A2N3HPX9_9FLAO|nr:outer membrane beta-barrel protein [Confluentibacter flavum]PKQ46918.1 hypothetical protein CSW08_00135 [Confluentibacter flavum]